MDGLGSQRRHVREACVRVADRAYPWRPDAADDALRCALAHRHPTGMMLGMTAVKLAISLPEEVVDKARREIRSGRATTMSAYVASAIRAKADGDDLMRMLAEILARTGGPMTAAEIRETDRELGLAPRRRRRSR
jgi:Arc/MetJ-type ribon-helix-helix transcriptional regulator